MTSPSFKQVLDILPGGLLITDISSRVVYVSGAFERRTGFSLAEIVGKKPGELWGGHMNKEFYQLLWKTIDTEGRPFVGMVQNVKKNGQFQEDLLCIAPLKDETGTTRYFAAFHPEFVTEKESQSFVRSFLSQAKKFHTDSQTLVWVFDALRKKKDGVLVPGTSSLSETIINPVTFFYEELIAPTEQVLFRRFEDAPLIQAAQKNPEHFSRLYEKYYSTLQKYFLRRLGGDQALAEDLNQEVFARAFRYLPSFRITNASYYTYLLRVSHSVLVNYYRKKKCDTLPLSDERALSLFDEQAGLDGGNIGYLLAPLSEMERKIMLLRYEQDLKVKEIAKQVGKTENAVKLILSRTRKKIKQAWN